LHRFLSTIFENHLLKSGFKKSVIENFSKAMHGYILSWWMKNLQKEKRQKTLNSCRRSRNY
ncbi:hypothetical protein, partial [Dubosiella newyorkensis]|uniref:hypothetical protein n=1 Tax=Dubosiella newyorkensis TaxID=1862672 RepID=UPI0026F3EF8A